MDICNNNNNNNNNNNDEYSFNDEFLQLQDPGNNNNIEKKEEKASEFEIDIAFCLDCTGSMNQYIKSAQNNIINIAKQISTEEGCDVRFALVAYRDIPPEDRTFITQITQFTEVPLLIQLKLKKLTARGGGDAPEALTSALNDCLYELNWRDESIKIIITIGDAPPHGLETEISDGFMDGDEIDGQRLNVIEIVKGIRDNLNASIYSVGCEPTLSCNFDFARDFYQYISETTGGKFLPLSSAELLPKCIIGSIKEQIATNQLMKSLETEMQNLKSSIDCNNDNEGKNKNSNNESKLIEMISQKWKNEGVELTSVSIGTLYRSERQRDNIDLLMNEQIVKSLRDFKKNCKLLKRSRRSDFRHLNVGKSSSKSRRIRYDDSGGHRRRKKRRRDVSPSYHERRWKSERGRRYDYRDDSPSVYHEGRRSRGYYGRHKGGRDRDRDRGGRKRSPSYSRSHSRSCSRSRTRSRSRGRCSSRSYSSSKSRSRSRSKSHSPVESKEAEPRDRSRSRSKSPQRVYVSKKHLSADDIRKMYRRV